MNDSFFRSLALIGISFFLILIPVLAGNERAKYIHELEIYSISKFLKILGILFFLMISVAGIGVLFEDNFGVSGFIIFGISVLMSAGALAFTFGSYVVLSPDGIKKNFCFVKKEIKYQEIERIIEYNVPRYEILELKSETKVLKVENLYVDHFRLWNEIKTRSKQLGNGVKLIKKNKLKCDWRGRIID